MSEKKYTLFVYGTLKQGHYWHKSYLGDDKSDFIGIVSTSNDFTLIVDALPYLIRKQSDGPVSGELYMVDKATLNKIDELEGHPSVYKREVISVFDESGEEKTAFAYTYPNVFEHRKSVIKEYNYD